MKKNLLLIGTAVAFSVLLLWPLRNVGDWYPMHDSTHPARLLLMRNAISSGNLPPLWAENINQGFGYPLFHFYAPLFHTLATVFSYLMPITVSLKLMLLISGLVGTLGVMFFVKRWGRLAALVAGAAFAFAPYAAISLYVRGSYSEYLSICLIPWVFLVTEKISSLRRAILAAIILSLFVLSHNLIPILVLPLVLLWLLFSNQKNFQLSILAVLLSIALSSWFVLPLIFERSFTKADEIARTTSYTLHFVEPWQLWNSTWGFGGSAPGVEDGLSFKLGKLQIILGLIGIIFAIVQKKRSLILLGAFLFLTTFLATPYSHPLWDASQTLQIVQFPWRTLGIITVFLAIFSGFAVSRLRSRVLRTGVTIIALTALVFLNYKYFQPQSLTQNVEIKDIAPVIPEYEPRWQQNPLPPVTDFPRFMSGITTVGRVYYPTWTVKVDGKKVATSPSESGLLSFSNPSNSQNIELIQSHTGLEKISSAVTVLTVLLIIYLWRKDVKA